MNAGDGGAAGRSTWQRGFQVIVLCGVAALAYVIGMRRNGGGTPPPSKPVAETRSEQQLPGAALQALAVAHRMQDGTSKLEHRDAVVAELRASGQDRRGMRAPAAQVLTGWKAKIAALGGEGRWGTFECYAKGCFVTAVHSTEEAASKASEVITRTGEFNGWQAGKMRSGIIARSDGDVEVTWVLYPPAPGSEALASTLPEDVLEELQRAWSPTLKH
jgi:hypothetical protein